MDAPKRCVECDKIASEMRAAFIRLIIRRIPEGDLPARTDLVQFLASLFASEDNLARLSDLWDQSEFSEAVQKWIAHRKATGHSGSFQEPIRALLRLEEQYSKAAEGE